MARQRILIVGASGFVGRALLRAVSGREDITAIAGVRDPENISDAGVESKIIDITRPEELARAVSEVRPDIVINAAAYGVRPGQQESGAAMRINTLGAVHLLEAAAVAGGAGRFIQLGSCSEYGNREGTVHEDMAPAPSTLYGSTKAAATVLVRERGAALGMDTLILRLFNLWGEGEPAHRLFPDLVAACRNRLTLELTDGRQIKDYSYVGDVAEWVIELARKPGRLDAGVVNVGSGRAMPLREFVLQIAEILGCVELLHFGAKSNRHSEAREQIPDLSRLENLLPDRGITPMAAALNRVLAETDTADS